MLLNRFVDIGNARLSKAVAQVIESVEGTHRSDQFSIISNEDKDYEYVKQLILRGGSARNKEEREDEISFFKLVPLEPRLFLLLEGERTEKDGDSWKRKLLFDAVNLSLTRQIKTWLRLQEKPWILMKGTELTKSSENRRRWCGWGSRGNYNGERRAIAIASL